MKTGDIVDASWNKSVKKVDWLCVLFWNNLIINNVSLENIWNSKICNIKPEVEGREIELYRMPNSLTHAEDFTLT